MMWCRPSLCLVNLLKETSLCRIPLTAWNFVHQIVIIFFYFHSIGLEQQISHTFYTV